MRQAAKPPASCQLMTVSARYFALYFLKKTASAAAAAAEMMPRIMPSRYWVSKWKMKEMPTSVTTEKAISFKDILERVRMGSMMAVKNPIDAKATIAIETFEALIDA